MKQSTANLLDFSVLLTFVIEDSIWKAFVLNGSIFQFREFSELLGWDSRFWFQIFPLQKAQKKLHEKHFHGFLSDNMSRGNLGICQIFTAV